MVTCNNYCYTGLMHSIWETFINCRSISWGLIAALSLALILPAHYHLHHLQVAGSADHGHSVDLHLITDNAALSHHEEGTSIFAATPDVIVKQDNPEFSPYLLLTLLLVILAVNFCQTRIRPGNRDPGRIQHYPFFSPPLRAPPLR